MFKFPTKDDFIFFYQKIKNEINRNCSSKFWITSQTNGLTGNRMLLYAHLKYLQLEYNLQVIYFAFNTLEFG